MGKTAEVGLGWGGAARSFFLLKSILGMDVQQIEAVVSEDRLEKKIGDYSVPNKLPKS